MREALTAAAVRRVTRPAPLRQAVYDALTELIVSGSLKPGQHLVEAELAEHLGRQPTAGPRSPSQRLETDGWVATCVRHRARSSTPHRRGGGPTARCPGEYWRPTRRSSPPQTRSPRMSSGSGSSQPEGVDALAAGDVERLVAAEHGPARLRHVLGRQRRTGRDALAGGPEGALVLHAHRQAPRQGGLERAHPAHQGHRQGRRGPRRRGHAQAHRTRRPSFYRKQIAAGRARTDVAEAPKRPVPSGRVPDPAFRPRSRDTESRTRGPGRSSGSGRQDAARDPSRAGGPTAVAACPCTLVGPRAFAAAHRRPAGRAATAGPYSARCPCPAVRTEPRVGR